MLVDSLESWRKQKAALDSHLTSITTSHQRPQLLHDGDFIESYKANKYWAAIKPFKEEVFSQSRVRDTSGLQKKYLRVNNINVQVLEKQSSDNHLELELDKFRAVVVQSQQNYQLLLVKTRKFKETVKKVSESHSGSKEEMGQFEKLKEDSDKLIRVLELLTVEWNNGVKPEKKETEKQKLSEGKSKHESESASMLPEVQEDQPLADDWKSDKGPYRIILLPNEDYEDYTLLLYQAQIAEQDKPLTQDDLQDILSESNNANFFTFPGEISSMLEILKIHRIKRIHQKSIEMIKRKIMKKTDESFLQRVQEERLKKSEEKKKLENDQKLKQAFENYGSLQKELMKEWHSKTKEFSKSSRLMVQVEQIWVQKTAMPASVCIMVRGEESQRKDYQYDGIEGDYVVFRIKENERSKKSHCITLDKSKVSVRKVIAFEADITFRNKDTEIFCCDWNYFPVEGTKGQFTQEIVLTHPILSQNCACLAYFSIVESKKAHIKSTVAQRKTALFSQIGAIPTKYGIPVQVNYTPETHPLVNTLLEIQNQGDLNITQEQYQRTYLELVKWMQRQENSSERRVMSNKDRKGYYAMDERLSEYARVLLREMGIGATSRPKDQVHDFFKGINEEVTVKMLQKEDTIMVDQIQLKNLQQDLKERYRFKPIIKSCMTKLIYFTQKVPRIKEFPYDLRYHSSLIPILERFLMIVIHNSTQDMRQSFLRGVETGGKEFLIFIAFLSCVYPYSSPKVLKNDLYLIRWLVQKRLPYFNDNLNRNHIGLENLASKYLLTLFSGLSPTLTYRIWDYLIWSTQRDKARVIVCFTLLSYLETTDLMPIIPITDFMHRVQKNMKEITADRQFTNKYANVANAYFESEDNKKRRFEKLMRDTNGVFIQDKYLRRMVLGEQKSKVPVEQDGRVHKIKLVQNKEETALSLKKLAYPLPKPHNTGHTIIEIIVFLHNLHILDNLNPSTQQYHLRFSAGDGNNDWQESIPIKEKHSYFNKTLRIPASAVNSYLQNPVSSQAYRFIGEKSIKVQIIKKGKEERVEMQGKLPYESYHKDRAYKTVVTLRSLTNSYNKGETSLTLTFCVKSDHHLSKVEKVDFSDLELMSERMLDYDIGSSNEVVNRLEKLYTTLQKVKNPIDEFSSLQYPRLQNSSISLTQSQWLSCSKVSIEQLKAIFYYFFSAQKDTSLSHQYTKYYEIFGEENNMQFIYLGDLLVRSILCAGISRKKKLTYLYCLGVHYQNGYTKCLTSETVNSLLRLIYRQEEIVNACPYVQDSCGKIVRATLFQTDLKNGENNEDFTDILRDWAYICTFKYGHNSVILGTHGKLSVLRELFDRKTLDRLAQEQMCRFEVVYELRGSKYVWSAVVKSDTFEIVKRGSKFLGTFATYGQAGYLNSTEEYLLNCENVISLQQHEVYSFSRFSEVMLAQPIIRYILDSPPLLQTNKLQEAQIEAGGNPNQEDDINEKKDGSGKQRAKYNSWGIYRSENCLANWRRCAYVSRSGGVLSRVNFEDELGTDVCIQVSCWQRHMISSRWMKFGSKRKAIDPI